MTQQGRTKMFWDLPHLVFEGAVVARATPACSRLNGKYSPFATWVHESKDVLIEVR